MVERGLGWDGTIICTFRGSAGCPSSLLHGRYLSVYLYGRPNHAVTSAGLGNPCKRSDAVVSKMYILPQSHSGCTGILYGVYTLLQSILRAV